MHGMRPFFLNRGFGEMTSMESDSLTCSQHVMPLDRVAPGSSKMDRRASGTISTGHLSSDPNVPHIGRVPKGEIENTPINCLALPPGNLTLAQGPGLMEKIRF